MSRLVIHYDDPWHGEMITRGINPDQPFRPNYDRCISVTHEGNFMGGVLYDNYHYRTIQMHTSAKSKRWLSRRVLYEVFNYPFNVLKVEKVYAPVETDNPHALKFDLKIGFVEEVRLVGAIPDGDLVVLSMTREQCRWLDYRPKGHPQNEQLSSSS